jgi:hypothetical protein
MANDCDATWLYFEIRTKQRPHLLIHSLGTATGISDWVTAKCFNQWGLPLRWQRSTNLRPERQLRGS